MTRAISDDEIRRALLDFWDPLSVGENPNLRDEYDEFIPRIRERLTQQSEGASDLADFLAKLEKELGTFDTDFDATSKTAAALIALR